MSEELKVKECTRCVLDTNDSAQITFDSEGVCSYCRNYEKLVDSLPKDLDSKKTFLDKKISEIKNAGKGRKYDCIMGLSGGIDSSYLAYNAKLWGLNPLIVHFDNGWNSELAVKNIENIINKLGFDLYTYVVDWEEFKNLQLSYIKASVLDWEIPTDHGFFAMMYDQAYKHNIKYILSGHNIVTEGILPKDMRWSKLDVANIKDIHKKYGSIPLKTFPLLGFFKNIYYQKVRGFEIVNPLNFVQYDKDVAKKIIAQEMGWRDYGGKHYESIFTRFYQGYVLLEKFGYDKRKAHLSTLINSGQISRDKAKRELSKSPYNTEQFKEDREYVIKKLGLTEKEFEEIMKQPVRSHLDFKSYETGLYLKHERLMKAIKPITRLVKKVI